MFEEGYHSEGKKKKIVEECELQGVHVSKDMYMLFNVTRGHCGTGSNDV